jgi:cell division protein FtsW
MAAAMSMDYRQAAPARASVYAVVAVTTLLLIAVLFMRPVNETLRWLRWVRSSFQPAELAKLAMILFLALPPRAPGDRVNEFLPSLFPALLLLGWFAFLIFIQPDLGTAATLVLVGGVMLYLAGLRLRYFAAFAVLAVPLLYHAVTAASYRRDRIEAYLNPWSDARGSGYQLIQSLIAVGTGGLRGVGLGEGPPEALLPALSVQRLHLRRDRRGAGPAGRGGGGPGLRAPALARDPRGVKAPDAFGRTWPRASRSPWCSRP